MLYASDVPSLKVRNIYTSKGLKFFEHFRTASSKDKSLFNEFQEVLTNQLTNVLPRYHLLIAKRDGDEW